MLTDRLYIQPKKEETRELTSCLSTDKPYAVLFLL
jgi:hypothetical protein